MLAYSTVSQLGFMFLASASARSRPAIFHLMTHAFFKALLFLGAGSVIHGMSGEQDIRKMGGLRTKMPVTFWTFLIGTLAIAGVPGLAGFFSKDEILWHAVVERPSGAVADRDRHGDADRVLHVPALFLTFFGEPAPTTTSPHHVHESPAVMTVPLDDPRGAVGRRRLGRASRSIGSGAIALGEFLAPVTGHPHAVEHAGMLGEGSLMIDRDAARARRRDARVRLLRPPARPPDGAELAPRAASTSCCSTSTGSTSSTTRIIVAPYVQLSTLLWKVVDQELIDGFVNGLAGAVGANGALWRRAQTGNVQHYALVFLGGVVVVLAYYVIR